VLRALCGERRVVNVALVVAVAALISSQALAQDVTGLATPTGHEVNVSIGGYTYKEPGALSISIDGAKIGGEYTGTLSLNRRRRWFTQGDVRGTFGNVTYGLVFAISAHAKQRFAKWLRARLRQSVAMQRDRRSGLVSGRPHPHWQGLHRPDVGVVTL
jgi:hypothetical protein